MIACGGEPAGGSRPVDFGTAALVPDQRRPSGRTLLIDGVPQSYVDPADPTYLEFEYVRRIARVVDAAAQPGVPLRVLHLGGGALTLPRYVAATRPGSAQRVVDRDARLTAWVLRELPLPPGAAVEVRIADARAAVREAADAGFDLVIGDVYRAAQMPASVASAEFAAELARVLHPDGLYAVNVADLPPLAFSRRQAATLRVAFPDVCVIAEPAMLRGRRYGNVVLVGARRAGGLPAARIAAAARRDPFPARLLRGVELDDFIGGALPVTDRQASDSPAPPPTLFAGRRVGSPDAAGPAPRPPAGPLTGPRPATR